MNITTEFRRKMIIKLIEALRESPSFGAISLTQLKEAVLNSEHQTFQQARSMDEYVYYINEKLKKIRQASSQRFEFQSDAKPNDDRSEQRRECEENGIADDYVKQTCPQEQVSGNARKKFDAFAMDPRIMSVGKKSANGADVFQGEHGMRVGQRSPSAGFFGYADNPSVQQGHFGQCMFGSPRAQEYRPGCGSPRASKDFFGCSEEGMPFKGEYSMRPGMARRSPVSRGCPPYEGYSYQHAYGSSDARHCTDFAEYSIRSGSMSSPGHRQDFGMSQGQRKDFRHGYCHSPHTSTGEVIYSGYRGAEYMAYPTGSPVMRDEGGSPGRDELHRMRNDAGIDGVPNIHTGLSGTMQQCGPRYKNGTGMSRGDGRHGYSSVQSRQEFEAEMKSSGTAVCKDRSSPPGRSQSPSNKSFVGNVNPSAMESGRQDAVGSREAPKPSSSSKEPSQSEKLPGDRRIQSFQSPDVSEISSFLESNIVLPFEPLKDSLDSGLEVPTSLQSFLQSNNLALKTVGDRESWCQLLDKALRKMNHTPITTSRHGEIRNLLTKQQEFLCHPFLDEYDIEEYSEYLSRGEIEHTHLIDRAIRAFAERRKREAGFVFNESGENGDK